MRRLFIAISLLVMPMKAMADQIQIGTASYYSKFENGRKTASGERYQPNLFTAASRTIPIGTFIKVINLRNNHSVIVKVNDVGPFSRSKFRILDLSLVAAKQLNMINSGLAHVKIIVLPKDFAYN